MTRAMIIGNAGGGKSTLCRSICAHHNLPHLPIDRIQWQSNWVRTPADDFNVAHETYLAGDHWLIDGYGPWDSVLRRMELADTIIFVDHPIAVHFWWATKRQVKSLFFGRPDGPEGCPMFPITIRLYRMMWWLHKEMRPKLISAITAQSHRARIVHIKNPKELASFAANPA